MGHLFLAQGDLLTLHADAVLIPTDRSLEVMGHWTPLLSGVATSRGRVEVQTPPGWGTDQERSLPLPAEPGLPRRWLTNTGSGGAPGAWYGEGARRFVERASQDRTSRAGRPRPLLALPLIGTGAGGAAHIAGDVIRTLVRALSEAAAEYDVDVVLTTRGEAAYAATQWARWRELEAGAIDAARHWRLDPQQVAEAKRLAADARHGRLVVFVGAGVSRGAGLPDWRGLLAELGRLAGLDPGEAAAVSKLDVLDQARLIERRLQRAGRELAVEITSLVDSSSCSLAHTLLASLPVEEYVTTNYDGLLEVACAGTDRPAAVLPYEPSPGRRWVLKLHGSTTHGRNDLVLTREDFIRYAERRGALAGIVQALLITRHMLFTGFSLDDDNFHRIADQVRQALARGDDASDPFGTVLTLESQPLLEELWRPDLIFVATGATPDLAQAANAHDRFLDLVGACASTTNRHLLDGRFADLLDDEDRSLVAALRQLEREAGGPAGDSRAWPVVAELLERLGGSGPEA